MEKNGIDLRFGSQSGGGREDKEQGVRNDQAPTVEDDDTDYVGEHDGALSIKLMVGCPSCHIRLDW